MSETPDLETRLEGLADELQRNGYPNLTASGDHISGVIYGVDLSDAPKSVPEGEDTGPFKTLDDPVQHVPEDLREYADVVGMNVEVLGHGPNRLHVYLTMEEGWDGPPEGADDE